MSDPVAITTDVAIGDDALALIAGPCAIEDRQLTLEIAGELQALCASRGVPLVFKASFDKANRTSIGSFRSIGFEPALEILGEVRATLGVAVMTDVHETWHVRPVAEVVNVIQIPAFLCRQTDLLLAAGASGLVVNIKKGQFMAPGDMAYAVEKVRAGGGAGVLLTERGTTFGYHDLVVDFRALEVMRSLAPVVFDATHSVQSPGGAAGRSGGHREYAAGLARAAVAFGVDALFLETHPRPAEAASDAASMLPLGQVGDLISECLTIRAARQEVVT
jgi:2-dehydro-3-deoxyphosphooctonate aldolase (KDO 8-P synthase)